MKKILLAVALIPALAMSQERPKEADLFGDAPTAEDAGTLRVEPQGAGLLADGGVDRDSDQLTFAWPSTNSSGTRRNSR